MHKKSASFLTIALVCASLGAFGGWAITRHQYVGKIPSSPFAHLDRFAPASEKNATNSKLLIWEDANREVCYFPSPKFAAGYVNTDGDLAIILNDILVARCPTYFTVTLRPMLFATSNELFILTYPSRNEMTVYRIAERDCTKVYEQTFTSSQLRSESSAQFTSFDLQSAADGTPIITQTIAEWKSSAVWSTAVKFETRIIAGWEEKRAVFSAK